MILSSEEKTAFKGSVRHWKVLQLVFGPRALGLLVPAMVRLAASRCLTSDSKSDELLFEKMPQSFRTNTLGTSFSETIYLLGIDLTARSTREHFL